MEKLRIMSFDLDSFTLVKSKEERAKRVIDYIKELDVDVDFALLQGDAYLLDSVIFKNKDSKDYYSAYNYAYTMFLEHKKSDWVEIYMCKYASCYVSKLDNSDIALYNIKKYSKNSLWEFRELFEEYKNIDHKVVAGTLQNVNIDDFCKEFNLDNICTGPRSNHILVSKGIDAKVVESPVMKSVEVQPMVVDVTYKKVRSNYEKFKNT